MELLEDDQDKVPGFINTACESLGCIDPRTARKHVRYIHATVKNKLPCIAELLSATPDPSNGQSFAPGTNLFAVLSLLWNKFLNAVKERSGTTIALFHKPILWLGPGLESWYFFNRSCIPIAQPP